MFKHWSCSRQNHVGRLNYPLHTQQCSSSPHNNTPGGILWSACANGKSRHSLRKQGCKKADVSAGSQMGLIAIWLEVLCYSAGFTCEWKNARALMRLCSEGCSCPLSGCIYAMGTTYFPQSGKGTGHISKRGDGISDQRTGKHNWPKSTGVIQYYMKYSHVFQSILSIF